MNDSKTSATSRLASFALLLSIGCIAVFFWIDRSLLGEVTMAPLLCAILLFSLSLNFRPSVVALCFLITIPYVVASLLAYQPHSELIARFWIRILTFLVIGFIAIMTSYFRCRLKDMLQQIKGLLAQLPVAVLLSGSTGRISWSNQMANQTLGIDPLNGKLLLECLPSNGSPIDYNLLLSSPGSDKFVQADLHDHSVKFLRLTMDHKRTLVTVIFPRNLT